MGHKDEKTAIITGSSRGLGAKIAITLLEKGYNVVVNYKQNKDKAEKLIRNYNQSRAIAIQADVTDRNDVNRMIQTATQHFGKIDIVINNALVGFKFDPNQQKSFKDLTWEDYQQQLNGTLKGAFNVTQSVIPQFIEQQSGCIVSIGTNLYQNPVVPYHEYTTARQVSLALLVILLQNLDNMVLQQMLFLEDYSKRLMQVQSLHLKYLI